MVTTISAAELAELAAIDGIDVIDVRGSDEFDIGHLAMARSLPLETLRTDPDAYLSKDRAVVFVCAKGIRSLAAAKLADRFGYRAYSLDGGTKSWSEAGGVLVTANASALAA